MKLLKIPRLAAALALTLAFGAQAAPSGIDLGQTSCNTSNLAQSGNIFQLAAGNTGACRRICDDQLSRCMSRNATNCHFNWKICNSQCEKSS